MREPSVIPAIKFREPFKLCQLVEKYDRSPILAYPVAFDYRLLADKFKEDGRSNGSLSNKEKRMLSWALIDGRPPLYTRQDFLTQALSFIDDNNVNSSILLGAIYCYFYLDPQKAPRCVELLAKWIKEKLIKYNGKNGKIKKWKEKTHLLKLFDFPDLRESINLLIVNDGSLLKNLDSYEIPLDPRSHISHMIMEELSRRIDIVKETSSFDKFRDILEHGSSSKAKMFLPITGNPYPIHVKRNCLDNLIQYMYKKYPRKGTKLKALFYNIVMHFGDPRFDQENHWERISEKTRSIVCSWLSEKRNLSFFPVAMQLVLVRNYLRHIKSQMYEFSFIHHKFLDENATLKCQYDEVMTHLIEGQQRLENPKISIALFGTTSSGKSTLVNALLGRRIAPMEAGEMSTGILRITNSPANCYLKVEETKNAAWDCHDWEEMEDEAIYHELSAIVERDGKDGIMALYKKMRDSLNSETVEVPKIGIKTPFPHFLWRHILKMPEDVELEIVDLPGLRHEEDKHNSQMIQSFMTNSLSIVIIDYLETDEKKRKSLLSLLEKTIKKYVDCENYRLFILNRVDLRNKGDISIEARIRLVGEEIKDSLKLKEIPGVVPLVAQLMYYLQSINEYTLGNKTKRIELIETIATECAKSIVQLEKKNNEFRELWKRIIDDTQSIGDEELLYCLDLLKNSYGGNAFYEKLEEKMDIYFAYRIIEPIISPINSLYKSFSSAFIGYCKSKIENIEKTLGNDASPLEKIIRNSKIEEINEIKEIEKQLMRIDTKVNELNALITS